MANKLKVYDLEFSTQVSARHYFYDIRDKYWQSKAVIKDSEVFEQLRDLSAKQFH